MISSISASSACAERGRAARRTCRRARAGSAPRATGSRRSATGSGAARVEQPARLLPAAPPELRARGRRQLDRARGRPSRDPVASRSASAAACASTRAYSWAPSEISMRSLAAMTSVSAEPVAPRARDRVGQQLVCPRVVAEHHVRRRVDEQCERPPLVVVGEARDRRARVGEHRADTVAAHGRAQDREPRRQRRIVATARRRRASARQRPSRRAAHGPVRPARDGRIALAAAWRRRSFAASRPPSRCVRCRLPAARSRRGCEPRSRCRPPAEAYSSADSVSPCASNQSAARASELRHQVGLLLVQLRRKRSLKRWW